MLAWALIAGEWLIRLGMTPVVVRKRDSSAALAWLAFIYFIPWVGAIAYLFIGEVDLGKKRGARHREAAEALRRRLDLHHSPEALKAELPAELDDLESLCRRVGGSPAVGGNRVEAFADTDEFLTALSDAIDSAEESVHLLYYIFGTSGGAELVAEALERASKRGVTCRVLVDAVGSKDFLRRRSRSLETAGVRVVSCLPVSLFRRALARIDLRNHRKLAVIDGRTAYVGSHNAIDADYGLREREGVRRVGPWHDLSARIDGPAVHELQAVFLEDWHAETGETLTDDELFHADQNAGPTAVQVAPSGPAGRPAAFRWLVTAAMHEAQQRLVITSPYLALDESTLRALQLTAMRGVEVRLVLPERSNSVLAAGACRACYRALLESGVRIHLHQDGLLHAKTLTVDDAFTLGGSGNFDMRSFLLNFELNTVLYGATATQRVREHQERYIGESRELTLEEWSKRAGWKNTLDRLAMLASPLL